MRDATTLPKLSTEAAKQSHTRGCQLEKLELLRQLDSKSKTDANPTSARHYHL
jgi:hypothetical protein